MGRGRWPQGWELWAIAAQGRQTVGGCRGLTHKEAGLRSTRLLFSYSSRKPWQLFPGYLGPALGTKSLFIVTIREDFTSRLAQDHVLCCTQFVMVRTFILYYIYVIFTKPCLSEAGLTISPFSSWGRKGEEGPRHRSPACQPGFPGHEQNWHLGSNQEVQTDIPAGVCTLSTQSGNSWTPDDSIWFPGAAKGIAYGINQFKVIQYRSVTGWSSPRWRAQERWMRPRIRIRAAFR